MLYDFREINRLRSGNFKLGLVVLVLAVVLMWCLSKHQQQSTPQPIPLDSPAPVTPSALVAER